MRNDLTGTKVSRSVIEPETGLSPVSGRVGQSAWGALRSREIHALSEVIAAAGAPLQRRAPLSQQHGWD
jgi:hypothetical protein